MFSKKVIFIYFFLININIIFITCSKELIELKLDLVKHGSLRNEEYDYYILSLTDQFDKDNHLIIELEPNPQLDLINNIINDLNLTYLQQRKILAYINIPLKVNVSVMKLYQ